MSTFTFFFFFFDEMAWQFVNGHAEIRKHLAFSAEIDVDHLTVVLSDKDFNCDST